MSVNVGQRNVPDTPSNNRCYAVDACLEKSLINIAKRFYHLREKKAGYWSRMRKSAYERTASWYESELNRYSEILKKKSLNNNRV